MNIAKTFAFFIWGLYTLTQIAASLTKASSIEEVFGALAVGFILLLFPLVLLKPS